MLATHLLSRCNLTNEIARPFGAWLVKLITGTTKKALEEEEEERKINIALAQIPDVFRRAIDVS